MVIPKLSWWNWSVMLWNKIVATTKWRAPGSDVLFYLPLNSSTTTTDIIWNYSWTWNNVTYDSIWAYFNWTNAKIRATSYLPDNASATVAFRCKCTPSQMSYRWWILFDWNSTGWHDFWVWFLYSSWTNYLHIATKWDSIEADLSLWNWDTTKYNCVIVTFWDWKVTCYVNSVQTWSVNISNGNCNVWYHYYPTIWNLLDSWTSWATNQWYKWYIWHIAYSNKVWDSSERLQYYSWLRSKYS